MEVSRRHCVVEHDEGGRFKIIDLESQNGTFVNGVPLTSTWLEHGDEIRISGLAARNGGHSVRINEILLPGGESVTLREILD